MRAITLLILTTALGTGLVAGTFFAFSSFVMPALGRLPPQQGMTAMQAINASAVTPGFMAAFMGTAIATLGLAVFACLRWSSPGSPLLLAGCLIYLIGSFTITAAFNVPLNDALAAARPDDTNTWKEYFGPWTAWNHVRTLASAASLVILVLALRQRLENG